MDSSFVAVLKKTYTDKQGQYLAFIYYYGKIHGRSPSEAEMQFLVSPPAVHQMVLTLEARGLIARTPGQSINPSADLAGRATRPGIGDTQNSNKAFGQPSRQDGFRLTLTAYS